MKALLVANDFLKQQLKALRTKVSTGYASGRLPQAREHKDGQMAEVTYYVALPFVFSDDGVAAGEATECFSANVAVMRAEACRAGPDTPARSRSAAARTSRLGTSATRS